MKLSYELSLYLYRNTFATHKNKPAEAKGRKLKNDAAFFPTDRLFVVMTNAFMARWYKAIWYSPIFSGGVWQSIPGVDEKETKKSKNSETLTIAWKIFEKVHLALLLYYHGAALAVSRCLALSAWRRLALSCFRASAYLLSSSFFSCP